MATTKQEIDSKSARDRLWDALDYSYGVKKEQSDASYDQLYSQTGNQLLGRGMQRSSYGAQTLANIGTQKVEAQNAIESEKIADYTNRLYQIERDEVADQQWTDTFNENQRQFNENLAETIRSNKATEDYQNRSLEETIRSNKATEDYNLQNLAETIRSNKATEDYNLQSLAETTRHNKATEEYDWAELDAKYAQDYEDDDSSSSSNGNTSSHADFTDAQGKTWTWNAAKKYYVLKTTNSTTPGGANALYNHITN